MRLVEAWPISACRVCQSQVCVFQMQSHQNNKLDSFQILESLFVLTPPFLVLFHALLPKMKVYFASNAPMSKNQFVYLIPSQSMLKHKMFDASRLSRVHCIIHPDSGKMFVVTTLHLRGVKDALVVPRTGSSVLCQLLCCHLTTIQDIFTPVTVSQRPIRAEYGPS